MTSGVIAIAAGSYVCIFISHVHMFAAAKTAVLQELRAPTFTTMLHVVL